MVEVTEITSAASIPSKADSILIPETTKVASHKTTAFITIVNNPKVKIVIGRVSKIKIGFITIFKRPITIAASKAVVKLSILNPATIKEAMIKESEENSQVKSNAIFSVNTI